MENWDQRTQLILGDASLNRIKSLHVMVVGTGGVGAYAIEMLARAGVGRLTIIDADNVSITNLNRQLIALNSTLGQVKTDVMERRLLDINPDIQIIKRTEFITPDSIESLFADEKPDYVVDAIDTVAPKFALITYCLRNRIKIISSMGAGGRMNPTAVQYADISETYHDGLAKAIRSRLKSVGIKGGLKVVWSSEQPGKSALTLTDECPNKRSSYGTISYMPCIFGCMLAAYIINKEKNRE